jgi:hypothetical protein
MWQIVKRRKTIEEKTVPGAIFILRVLRAFAVPHFCVYPLYWRSLPSSELRLPSSDFRLLTPRATCNDSCFRLTFFGSPVNL